MAYTGQHSVRNQSSQPTILCVEDNQAYLRLRKAVLEKEGYSVLAASTGAEALHLFREVARLSRSLKRETHTQKSRQSLLGARVGSLLAWNFNDIIANRVQDQFPHTMQTKLAHQIAAMRLGCLHTHVADPQG